MLTVVSPAASQRLTSESRARDHLGLSVEEAAQSYLLNLIDAASAAIVGYCGRPFARETLSETVRSLGSGPIILSRASLAGPITVSVDGASITGGQFECDLASGLLHRVNAWGVMPWCGRAAVVTYASGWIVPEDQAYGTASYADRLPPDVEQACLTMIAARHAARSRDPMLRSESAEGIGSASYIATADMGALPPQVVGLLAPYRLCRVI